MGKMHGVAMLAGAAALALTVAACDKLGVSQGAGDAGKVKSALKADEKAWNAQFKSKDLEGLLGHYADDAYFVAPGAKPATGSTEIRRVYADGLTDQNFAISFASDTIDVAGSGDMAYTRGRFTETSTDPKTNQPATEQGSYVTVYKKQPDGSWKAVEDFAAADPGGPVAVKPGKPATRAKMVSF